MVFDRRIPAGIAQVVYDRLTSFGWTTEESLRFWDVDVDRLYFTPETRGAALVEVVLADLAVQGLRAAPEPAPTLGRSVELGVSTPLATWNDASPEFGWCFRDLEASRENRRDCYPSRPLCEAHLPEIGLPTPAALENVCRFDDTLRGLRNPSKRADGLGWEGVFD